MQMIPASFNRVTVDLEAIKHNYRLLKKAAGNAAFLAMVKADGYGHGMIECSRALQEEGCRQFGVAELREAILLRHAGIQSTIYVMVGIDPMDAEYICEYNLTPVVYDMVTLEALSQAAQKHNRILPVHLKVDCGMSRLGIQEDQIEAFLQKIESLSGIQLAGIASHFPSADDVASESTANSYRRFQGYLSKAGKKTSIIRHIANSGATLYFPETHSDMVRCGISLYGCYPDGEKKRADDGLQPVMSFTTRVVQVKDIPEGTGVSYGSTYVTTRPTRLAVLPIGYEDGFSRQLSNCGEVLIRGRRAPVRGRVCMNLTMVDVTDIEGVTSGDEVVILGEQGTERITADEIAAKIGTISYEVLCMIGNNNERIIR